MHNEEIDKLTRLLKETYLEEELYREIKRAERYKRPLTFLLLDPGVPDENFHQVGYLALKKLAGIVRDLTRYLDIKVRCKNRILILLPETDLEGGFKVAIKIKEKMDGISFREFPNVKLDGNIGLATFPEDGIEKKAIMLSLDQDLETPFKEKIPNGLSGKRKKTDGEDKIKSVNLEKSDNSS